MAHAHSCTPVMYMISHLIAVEHVVEARVLMKVQQGLHRQGSWNVCRIHWRRRVDRAAQLMEELQIVCRHKPEYVSHSVLPDAIICIAARKAKLPLCHCMKSHMNWSTEVSACRQRAYLSACA